MLALSKPISSPSRTDKFPPPLLKFLRSNVGSRSRGRSRTSPIFYTRSRKIDASVGDNIQEPSSPKVTCIGQVRVRRSAGVSKTERTGGSAASRHTCWWVKKALFGERNFTISCCRKRSFRRVFCKWGLFFRSGYCKKVDATEDSSFRDYSDQKSENYEYFGAGVQEFKRDLLESPSSPPKNALILTRCRSAPYRSSSLGGRFWSSPLSENENELEKEAKSEELKEPRYENSPESMKESENSGSIEQESVEIAGNSLHPLLLTRCKSEPARTGARLDPETTLWRQRKLGAQFKVII